MKLGLRELLFATLMIGLMAGSYFFVLKPAVEKRTAQAAKTAARKKDLADLRQATAGIGDIERKIQELEEAIGFFESKLPAQKELDTILKDVWQRADQNGLHTRTIKTDRTERAAGYSAQPIQLRLSGDFQAFYTFLLQLEKLPRLTQVTQMKLDKMMERDGAMDAQMTLVVFFESRDEAKLAGAH